MCKECNNSLSTTCEPAIIYRTQEDTPRFQRNNRRSFVGNI